MSQAEQGRTNQKNRTRAALLEATRSLLREGKQPTLPEAADLAKISRATAYRYYSNAEVMAHEAVLDGLALEIDAFEEPPAGAQKDLKAQLVGLVDQVLDLVLRNEPLFRLYLRSTLGAEPFAGRGARRTRWVADIVARFPGALSAGAVEQLTAGLALLTGIETIIVLRDICQLDDRAIRKHLRWQATVMIDAVITG